MIHCKKNNPLYLILVCVAVMISGCKATNKEPYVIKIDFRFGYKFFSVRINEKGRAYVLKGKGNFFTYPMKIVQADTSRIFTLDSIKSLNRNISKLKQKPAFSTHVNTDSPRAEVYYLNQKIMDNSQISSEFIDLIKPIITQLPRGFNPFFGDEDPFDLNHS